MNRRPVRYVVSGILSFGIENLSFIALYYAADMNPMLSNLLSLGIALSINFLVSKYYVFQNFSSHKALHQAVMYGVLVTLNAIVSTYVVVTLIDYGAEGYAAKLVTTFLVAGWTYVVYKKIIFTVS